MTAQELDTMMQSILIDALQADWSNDIEATPPVAPSVKYRRWERAILVDPFRWYRRKMRPHWKKCLQNIAAVLLVVLLSFATLMAVSPTARATVVKWFEVQRENYIEYFFTDRKLQVQVGHPHDKNFFGVNRPCLSHSKFD